MIFRVVYPLFPNFLVYNLSLKIPLILANVGLAYLVRKIILESNGSPETATRAWLFLLFNPLILLSTAAWGQIDTLVAFLGLLSLWSLFQSKFVRSSLLLALSISIKPIALPLLPVILLYLHKKTTDQIIKSSILFLVGIFALCIFPFFLFHWDSTPILQGWNAHFKVGGGLTLFSALELFQNSYAFPSTVWWLGLVWILGLSVAFLFYHSSFDDFSDLIRAAAFFITIFFLTRTWLSEPNLPLLIPFIVLLTSAGALDKKVLTLLWVIPLIFSILNTSLFQLLFPSFPGLMEQLLIYSDHFRIARLLLRSLVVIPWILVGGWIAAKCSTKLTPDHGLETTWK